jgi:hypothetical protein
VYRWTWCTPTPYVVGSSCSHGTAIIAVCSSAAAHAPAEQQQPSSKSSDTAATHARDLFARAFVRACCRGCRSFPRALSHFTLGQAEDGVGAGPATLLGHFPTGRPATAHPCARRWPCLLGRRREWCLSKNEQSEGVFLDSPCALPSVCRFSLVVVVVVSGCRRCLTQAPASHLHSLPVRTAHRIPPLLGCRCRRPTSLTTQCSLSSPALSQRLVHRTHSTHSTHRIARIATARPRVSSSSQQPASSHHCNGVVQTHLRQHYSLPFALRQPALLACCCSSSCTQARGALQCPPSAAALAACPPVCHRTLQASACCAVANTAHHRQPPALS